MNDRKERITRALRLNAADIRDGQTAVAEFGESLPTHLDIQLEQICAVGARSHISSSSINKWPKFTEIVKAAGPASHRALGAWRVCSGLAHGKRWPRSPSSSTRWSEKTPRPVPPTSRPPPTRIATCGRSTSL